MDSETKISNIRILSHSVFPDTTKLYFDGEEATLKELLDQRVPLGVDKKISAEYFPETLIYERGFSGAKIAAISNTVIAAKNKEQYIPFEQKIFDYEGAYLHDQIDPPGGYKFCVSEDAVYGVSLELKFKNSAQSSVTNLSVKAKVERSTEGTYTFDLLKKEVTANETESIFTGVKELMLEEGDCVFFVLEQDALGGVIQGSFSTQATIHKVIKLPETDGGTGGVITDCNAVLNCLPCPTGITTVINRLDITAPNGYLGQPSHNVALSVQNCTASLTGTVVLPEPSAPECDPNGMVACLSQANASPEDLGIVFSQEQIMAIVGGFTTLTQHSNLQNVVANIENCCTDNSNQFSELLNTVTKLEGYFQDVFGEPHHCNNVHHYDPLCDYVDNCS